MIDIYVYIYIHNHTISQLTTHSVGNTHQMALPLATGTGVHICKPTRHTARCALSNSLYEYANYAINRQNNSSCFLVDFSTL